ncbi:MAG: glycosyltransferase [Campylobacterales bacterium]|nr:glycosyltransferase [Campylobacterales bacterium]
MKKIVILGGARDFHAMDWYRAVQKNAPKNEVIFLTDLIGGEGYDNLLVPTDDIEKLFIIDKFLCSKQSTFGNIWRNLLKLLVLPIQICKLKKFHQKNPDCIYHAHPMYYMFLCWLSGIEYIGSPQGDEILIRPHRSWLYRYFAVKVLRTAKFVIVDSQNMQKEIKKLSGVDALVHQYGIDIDELQKYNNKKQKTKVASIRGMLPLYRIHKILESRSHSVPADPIHFIYPYYEESYSKSIKQQMLDSDVDLGRLNKQEMYSLLSESYLAVSIPESDSSPRSVYESIFLGCCVAIEHNPYLDTLPMCMKERVVVVDLDDKYWFGDAVKKACEITKVGYFPSEEAINMFDQNLSIRRVIGKLYV